MKRTILTIIAAALLPLCASAQSLGSLLGKVADATSGNGNGSGLLNSLTEVVYSYTGNLTAVQLPGSWTYEGSAISLGSDNALSNIAGTAASATVEKKVDEYLAKVGITKGALGFTFNEDLSFVCTVKSIPVSGTWRMLEDGKTVQLQFGKNMKYLSLTGDLKNSAAGCEMLFEGKKFLGFVKTVLSYVGKQSGTAATVASLAESYNDMKIGFELSKVK